MAYQQPDSLPADPRIERLRALGASVGQGVYLGADIYIELDFAPLLTIEDGVVLARGVSVLLHDSSLNNVAGEPVKFGRVVLRRNCYVGANSTIACGVEIGGQAVVGACSLVTADVPAAMYAFGQPARVHGSVDELVAKHRAQAEAGGRFFYLPLTPWRDRQSAEAGEQAARQIEHFLASVTRRD